MHFLNLPALSESSTFGPISTKESEIRSLSEIEQAFTITNQAFPLSVVCVLHLTSGPNASSLKQALGQLQSRHRLLRSGIVAEKGGFRFQPLDPVVPIPLNEIERTEVDYWRGVMEDALNTPFDQSGPLMKCWYVTASDSAEGELIVGFHHAIIDGISARLLLHEILSLAGGISLPQPSDPGILSAFPPAYQKWHFWKRLPGFFARQMADEWRYRRRGVTKTIPRESSNAVLSFRLSPEVSRKLSLHIGREGLSLNSVLLALIARKVYQYRHQEDGERLVRVISFADLRPAMQPPVSGDQLGCYISMLRFSIPVSPDQSGLSIASGIRKAIFQASRRGDVFMMSKMSKSVMRMVLKLRNMRLGVAALSFIGKLELEAQYGPIQLRDVHACISNNPLGAEFSAFGKILFGSIGVDFNYLREEIPMEQAEKIVEEIRMELEAMANIPYL